MSSGSLYLGVDCSAYTTSLALVDGEKQLLWERRRMIPVRKGARGLRQSEAVFAHIQNLPEMWEEGAAFLRQAPLVAVAAAVKPRPLPRSYMPVFKVSEAAGALIARTSGCSYYAYSHQEGHLAAGLWSAGLAPDRYLAVHLSGGTTEIVAFEAREPEQMAIERRGGGSDLHAGQFVDRIGVAMGLPFPAGPALEQCAGRGATGAIRLPVAVRDGEISFSGPESQAQRLLQQGADHSDLARAVELCIADSLAAALRGVADLDTFAAILVVGGVAANAFIRRRLRQEGPDKALYFASPAFSGDNAVGLAVLAVKGKEEQKREETLKISRNMN